MDRGLDIFKDPWSLACPARSYPAPIAIIAAIMVLDLSSVSQMHRRQDNQCREPMFLFRNRGKTRVPIKVGTFARHQPKHRMLLSCPE
jgi:hypothetical protein